MPTRRKQQGKRQRRKKPRGGKKHPSNVTIQRNIISETTITVLHYTDLTLSRLNAAAAQFALFSLRLNDVYDPDPLFGTGSLSGFNEYCQFYNRYRVLSAKVHWEIVNTTNQDIMTYMYATPSASFPLTVTNAINYRNCYSDTSKHTTSFGM